MSVPSIETVVAPNPGVLTGAGTNTYVVGRDPAVVIDPAVEEPAYLERVAQQAGDIAAILVTHRHPDHVGGIAPLVAGMGATVRAFGTDPAGGIEVDPVHDGEVVLAGDVVLTALHTPGHARDHVCFVLDAAGALFSGDNILGEGTAVIAPPDGDMGAYMASLQRLRALGVVRIYPGHGPALDAAERVIDGYIEHRLARERAIVAAVGAGATLEEIVERAYADTPKALHPIAAYSARAHLEWLVAKGEIGSADDKWVLTDVN